jgi:Tfp pilus assembly protein PilX
MSKQKNQRGVLLIGAVILIVVMSILVTTIAKNTINMMQKTSEQIDATDAFYIANAGLQRAGYAVINPNIDSRVACQNITGHDNFSDVTFSNGQFNVTGTVLSSTQTLSTNITNSQTMIPLLSITGLADYGKAMVEREIISYSAVSTDSASCGGNASCILDAKRGQDGSPAKAHGFGATLSQAQCHLESTGAVPSLANPLAKRIVSSEISSYGQGWVVGDHSTDEVIAYFNGADWQAFGPLSNVPNVDINALSLLSYGDLWAVGDREGGDALFLHWDGASWTRVLPGGSVGNENLNSVDCVTTNDCWAVGGGRAFAFWNGVSWGAGNVQTTGTPATGEVPNVTMNSVSCVDSNDCWAVGNRDSGDAVFVHWDGLQWLRVLPDASVANANLSSVHCSASDNCWAVGTKEGNQLNINYYNGSFWSRVYASNSLNKDLEGVFCLSDTDCWAVGQWANQEPLIEYWDGVSWQLRTAGGDVPAENLKGIHCSNTNNCWVVGNNRTVGYWNGTTWQSIDFSQVSAATYLNSLIILEGPTGTALQFWREQ